MVSGERRSWAAKFRIIDRKFLYCVARVWWRSISHLPLSSYENEITKALVDNIARDAEARSAFYCAYQFFTTVTSHVDMALIINNDRSTYLAYECKRLNVIRQSGARRALAAEYIDDGIKRFFTEQYAEDLPTGCMIGYVMDGDLDAAYSRIRKAMTRKRRAVGLHGDFRAQDPIGQFKRFATNHVSGEKAIEILHALLPFVNDPAGTDAESRVDGEVPQ